MHECFEDSITLDLDENQDPITAAEVNSKFVQMKGAMNKAVSCWKRSGNGKSNAIDGKEVRLNGSMDIEEEDVDGKPFFSTILPLVIRGKKLEALYSINYAKGKFGNISASRRAKKYYEDLKKIGIEPSKKLIRKHYSSRITSQLFKELGS